MKVIYWIIDWFKYKLAGRNICLKNKDIVVITTSLNTDRMSAYYARRTKFLFDTKMIKYNEIDLVLLQKEEVDKYRVVYPEAKNKLPAIYIDNKFIGSFDQLQELEDADKLDELVFIQMTKNKYDDHDECDLCAFSVIKDGENLGSLYI
jgi:glutaredoxin